MMNRVVAAVGEVVALFCIQWFVIIAIWSMKLIFIPSVLFATVAIPVETPVAILVVVLVAVPAVVGEAVLFTVLSVNSPMTLFLSVALMVVGLRYLTVAGFSVISVVFLIIQVTFLNVLMVVNR